jgi:hypothetical protein
VCERGASKLRAGVFCRSVLTRRWRVGPLAFGIVVVACGDPDDSSRGGSGVSSVRTPTCLGVQEAECDVRADECGELTRADGDEPFGSSFCRAQASCAPLPAESRPPSLAWSPTSNKRASSVGGSSTSVCRWHDTLVWAARTRSRRKVRESSIHFPNRPLSPAGMGSPRRSPRWRRRSAPCSHR